MNAIAKLFLVAIWVAGVVIAKGFWSTLIAFCIPFWGWYIVAERVMIAYGWIAS